MLYSSGIKNDCINSTEINIKRVQSAFSLLSENQLNWKPSSEVWSIGECINHIVKTNGLYLSKIENILGSSPAGSEGDFPYSQSFMGKMITKAVEPANIKKFKTFKVFLPGKSAVRKTIIDDYVNSSKRFIEQINKMRDLDLKKLRLSSPVSILIRLNLGDVLIIISKHDERHINQAECLMKTENFHNQKK